jgi:hypothetical protein
VDSVSKPEPTKEEPTAPVEEPKEKTTDPRDPAVITFEEDINFFDVK